MYVDSIFFEKRIKLFQKKKNIFSKGGLES